MSHSDGADPTAILAALADPSRRGLYEAVRRSVQPLGRDELAEQVGLPRATAAFHLDRLVEVGALTSQFHRRSGRTGPGAGRPAKLYSVAADELTVSLPTRQYELAGDMLATAADRSEQTGAPMRESLIAVAEARGHDLGSPELPLVDTLTSVGYAPAACADGGYRLTNCPFHRLATRHTTLICSANTAFVRGLVDESPEQRDVWLEPTAGECCVRIGTERSSQAVPPDSVISP
ncbi:MAG TPA: helix-turn-helix domain-containing protein [Microbacterium sp.]|nr:helix-turn-helix domain-containing protein [Microbacterium sp.]